MWQFENAVYKQFSRMLRTVPNVTCAHCSVVVDGNSNTPAVPFSDSLWSVFLMDPSCVRFLERLTVSMQPKTSTRSDQSKWDDIDEPDQAMELQLQVESAKEFKPASDRDIPVTSLPNEAVQDKAQVFPSDTMKLAISESSGVAERGNEPERLDRAKGISSEVSEETSMKVLLDQVLIPVSNDTTDICIPRSKVENSVEMMSSLTDVQRELDPSGPKS